MVKDRFGAAVTLNYGYFQARTQTYVAFDGDADLMSFRTIQSWSADPKIMFTLDNAHDLNYARDDSLPSRLSSNYTSGWISVGILS